MLIFIKCPQLQNYTNYIIKILIAIFTHHMLQNQYFHHSKTSGKCIDHSSQIKKTHQKLYHKFSPNSFKKDQSFLDESSLSLDDPKQQKYLQLQTTKKLKSNHQSSKKLLKKRLNDSSSVEKFQDQSLSEVSVKCINGDQGSQKIYDEEPKRKKLRRLSFAKKQQSTYEKMGKKAIQTLEAQLKHLGFLNKDIKTQIQESINEIKQEFTTILQQIFHTLKNQISGIVSVIGKSMKGIMRTDQALKQMGYTDCLGQNSRDYLKTLEEKIKGTLNNFETKISITISRVQQIKIKSLIKQEEESMQTDLFQDQGLINKLQMNNQQINKIVESSSQNSKSEKNEKQEQFQPTYGVQQPSFPSPYTPKVSNILQGKWFQQQAQNNTDTKSQSTYIINPSSLPRKTHQKFRRRNHSVNKDKKQLNQKMKGFEQALVKIRNMIKVREKNK